MHYLKNEPFISVVGEPFRISDPEAGIPEHEGSVPEMLKITLEKYVPRQGKTLETAGEIRSLNRCIDVLDSEPGDGGYYAFEDEHWKTLRRVCEWMLPVLPWFRNTPLIMDAIDKTLTHLPSEAVKDKADAKQAEEAEA